MASNNRIYVYDPYGETVHMAYRLSVEGCEVCLYQDVQTSHLSEIVEQTRRGPRKRDVVLFSADDGYEHEYAMQLRADGWTVLGGSTCAEDIEDRLKEMELNYTDERQDLYYATIGWFNGENWIRHISTAVCASRLLVGGYGPIVKPMWTGSMLVETLPSAIEHCFTELIKPLIEEEYCGPITICWHYGVDDMIMIEEIRSDWSHDALIGSILLNGLGLKQFIEKLSNGEDFDLAFFFGEKQYVATARIGVPPFPFSGQTAQESVGIMMEDLNSYWLIGVEKQGESLLVARDSGTVGIVTAIGQMYSVGDELKRRIDRLQLIDKMWRIDVNLDMLERISYPMYPMEGTMVPLDMR